METKEIAQAIIDRYKNSALIASEITASGLKSQMVDSAIHCYVDNDPNPREDEVSFQVKDVNQVMEVLAELYPATPSDYMPEAASMLFAEDRNVSMEKPIYIKAYLYPL